MLILPLRSWSPATSHGLQPVLPAHACAGKMLNGSVQAKCSARLWVVPGPRTERQGAGNPGFIALEVDGARGQRMSLAAEMGRLPDRAYPDSLPNPGAPSINPPHQTLPKTMN